MLVSATIPGDAQSLTAIEIVGSWSVSKVNVLDSNVVKEQKDQFNLLKEAFLKSKFTFKPDHRFLFDFSYEEMKVKDGYWRQDKSTNNFIIHDWVDKDTKNYVLMEVSANKEGNRILFYVSQIPFELEVKKY